VRLCRAPQVLFLSSCKRLTFDSLTPGKDLLLPAVVHVRGRHIAERLVRWGVHPANLVTHRFALDKADEAYELMADGKCGEVAVVFDEELT
jgi:threonine dehydrogenase-like Zn-dependent dehydrogenase